MVQNGHNMKNIDNDKDSDESTITHQTVRFSEIMHDSDMEEVD